MIEIKKLPKNTNGALTLNTEYLYNPIKYNGWKLSGEIHEYSNVAWINEFEATKNKEVVYGDFENKIYATSQTAYDDFIKNCPPRAWNYHDINIGKIILTRINKHPENPVGVLTLGQEYFNNPSQYNGWDVLGDVHELGSFKWINEFVAKNGNDIVWGDFKNIVYATSQKAYYEFIKNCPPQAWNYYSCVNWQCDSLEIMTIYYEYENYNKKEVEENNMIPNESDTREQLKRSQILFL